MLRRTKNLLRAYGVSYDKEHVNPMMVPERVYVLRFGKDPDNLNNRFIVDYNYTITGRIKINKISLRLHKQVHPREFANEAQLLSYLKRKAYRYTGKKQSEMHAAKSK